MGRGCLFLLLTICGGGGGGGGGGGKAARAANSEFDGVVASDELECAVDLFVAPRLRVGSRRCCPTFEVAFKLELAVRTAGERKEGEGEAACTAASASVANHHCGSL